MWLSSFRALLVFLDHTCLWRKQARVYHQWFPICRWCNLWGNLSLYPRTSGLISHRSYSELFPRVGSFCPSDSRANISSSGEEEAMVAVHLLLDLLQQPHLLQPQPLQLSPSGPTVGHSLLSLSSVNIFWPSAQLAFCFKPSQPHHHHQTQSHSWSWSRGQERKKVRLRLHSRCLSLNLIFPCWSDRLSASSIECGKLSCIGSSRSALALTSRLHSNISSR